MTTYTTVSLSCNEMCFSPLRKQTAVAGVHFNDVSIQGSRFRSFGFHCDCACADLDDLQLGTHVPKHATCYSSLKWTWGCRRAWEMSMPFKNWISMKSAFPRFLPCLPSWKFSARGHRNGNPRVWVKFWPRQLQQMNLSFKKPLLQVKAFLKHAIWK